MVWLLFVHTWSLLDRSIRNKSMTIAYRSGSLKLTISHYFVPRVPVYFLYLKRKKVYYFWWKQNKYRYVYNWNELLKICKQMIRNKVIVIYWIRKYIQKYADTIEIDVTQKFKVLHNARIRVDVNGKVRYFSVKVVITIKFEIENTHHILYNNTLIRLVSKQKVQNKKIDWLNKYWMRYELVRYLFIIFLKRTFHLIVYLTRRNQCIVYVFLSLHERHECIDRILLSKWKFDSITEYTQHAVKNYLMEKLKLNRYENKHTKLLL